VAVLVLAAMAGGAPAASADAGSHHVKVYVTASVNSVYYSTSNSSGANIIYCATLPHHEGTEWFDGGMDVRNGRSVTMITFGSGNCSDTYLKRFDMTAPESDGFTNWWVNLV
jgi:hypothetical protein